MASALAEALAGFDDGGSDQRRIIPPLRHRFGLFVKKLLKRSRHKKR